MGLGQLLHSCAESAEGPDLFGYGGCQVQRVVRRWKHHHCRPLSLAKDGGQYEQTS